MLRNLNREERKEVLEVLREYNKNLKLSTIEMEAAMQRGSEKVVDSYAQLNRVFEDFFEKMKIQRSHCQRLQNQEHAGQQNLPENIPKPVERIITSSLKIDEKHGPSLQSSTKFVQSYTDDNLCKLNSNSKQQILLEKQQNQNLTLGYVQDQNLTFQSYHGQQCENSNKRIQQNQIMNSKTKVVNSTTELKHQNLYLNKQSNQKNQILSSQPYLVNQTAEQHPKIKTFGSVQKDNIKFQQSHARYQQEQNNQQNCEDCPCNIF